MALSLDGSLPAFLSSRWPGPWTWPSWPWPERRDRTCVTGSTGRHVWSLSVFVILQRTPRVHAGRRTIFARASRRQTGKALQLSRDIGRLTQPDEILAFVKDHVHEFSFVHAVSCFSRLGRMRHKTRQSWSASEPFQNLVAAIDDFGERGEMDAEALRATLVAAVYLANGDIVRRMVSKCATALLAKLPAASLPELANSAWALGKLEHCNEKLLRGISSEVLRKVAIGQAMSVRDVQKLVWALAAFGWHEDPSLFRCLSANVQMHCNEMSAVDASVIAFSFARLGVEDSALFRVLSQHVQDRLLVDLNAQGIAKVAYSFAVLGHAAEEPRLFRALAAESARRIAAFGAQELANLMQALVWCRAAGCAIFASPEVQRFLALASRRCMELCPSAIPKDLCCFAWSFASLGSHCDIVLPAVAEASIYRVPDFDPRFLSGQLAWAFASTGTVNPALFDAIAVAALDRKRSYAPRDISNLAWSFAMLGHRSLVLFDSLCGRAIIALERFNSQDLANMLWAYSHLGIRAPALFAASEERVKATISRPSLQELSSIAWAYENAGMMSSALLLAIEREFAKRLLLGPGKARPAQRARDVKALLRQLRSTGLLRHDITKTAKAELQKLGKMQDAVMPVECSRGRGLAVGAELPRTALRPCGFIDLYLRLWLSPLLSELRCVRP
ncbi:ylyB [Symbiodinium necroappetens]|uniref:YlyB protein n=1 Tax=Symbiodinium necroappetens TaxID=1628268 RepID=A0A812NIT1_9DINO|nr:ylyB [Symbiodinium necroappetens]